VLNKDQGAFSFLQDHIPVNYNKFLTSFTVPTIVSIYAKGIRTTTRMICWKKACVAAMVPELLDTLVISKKFP